VIPRDAQGSDLQGVCRLQGFSKYPCLDSQLKKLTDFKIKEPHSELTCTRATSYILDQNCTSLPQHAAPEMVSHVDE